VEKKKKKKKGKKATWREGGMTEQDNVVQVVATMES
jgi:hypothetical protein